MPMSSAAADRADGPVAVAIRFLIGNYLTTLFVLGLIVAAISVIRHRHDAARPAPSGVFLRYYVFYAVGVNLAVNFVMHSVFGRVAAESIGWAQSPFQLELAFASLGFAVVAFVVYGDRGTFRARAAVVIGAAIFGLGAAGGHIFQVVVNDNHAVNNSGLLLYIDILSSLVGVAFVVWHAVARRSEQTSSTRRAVALDEGSRPLVGQN